MADDLMVWASRRGRGMNSTWGIVFASKDPLFARVDTGTAKVGRISLNAHAQTSLWRAAQAVVRERVENETRIGATTRRLQGSDAVWLDGTRR